MKKTISLILLAGAAAALPASAEISAHKERVKGTSNAQTIRLDGATLFGSGDDKLIDSGRKALDKVLRDNPTLGLQRIRVTGHTDNMGKPADNGKLSVRRAEAVRKYLLSKDRNLRIEISGLGDTKPLVKCDAGKPRAELIRCLAPNRRVEIDPLYD
jgi:outer membrane protein OmpA-like peptidoglycan-associated protein